jgi:hypothetical protein
MNNSFIEVSIMYLFKIDIKNYIQIKAILAKQFHIQPSELDNMPVWEYEIFVGEINDMVKEERKNDSEQYETVGWVRVQGTNIDYPIIHIKDETYGQPVSDKSYAWTDFESGELKKINPPHSTLN